MSAHDSPAIPYDDGGWTFDQALSVRVAEVTRTPTMVYRRSHLNVLSSAEMAEYRGLICAHNHVSVSVDPALDRRPTDGEMNMVREDFDMWDAEEDNHQPGRIRNLFLPLHLPRGTVGVCDCKSDETEVVEPDGFVWSKAVAP